LAFLSGCATWEEVTEVAASPFQRAEHRLAQTTDPIRDRIESLRSGSSQVPKPMLVPAPQVTNSPPMRAGTKPIIQPTGNEAPPASRPLKRAPGDVELLPAPPVSPTAATTSKADDHNVVASKLESAPSGNLHAKSAGDTTKATWCRIHIRNVSEQLTTNVAVTVVSPTNAPLLSKSGETVSNPAVGPLQFAAVEQVAPREEIILIVGVASTDAKDHRLRVQIRDAQGGSHSEVQSRWQVSIEAAE
jgi:hypothetical protein